MRLTAKRVALSLLIVWEAWWVVEYLRAPVPDYEMRKLFAVLMAVIVPCVEPATYLIVASVRALVTSKRSNLAFNVRFPPKADIRAAA
jgi:hypothetical protein